MCIPVELWNLLFPGVDDWVASRSKRGQKLHFVHYAVTDGWDFSALFTVEQFHRRFNVHGYSSSNYRSLVNPDTLKPLKICDFTADRKPYQGASNSNTFHGKGNFDYMVEHVLLQRGPEAVKDALRHPWIVLDPGIINAIGGCVVKGELIVGEDGRPLGVDYVFTRFLFPNKGRYTPIQPIVDIQSTRVQSAFKKELLELAEHHGRTMDAAAYEKHCDVFSKLKEPMAESNREIEALMNGQKLKVSLF